MIIYPCWVRGPCAIATLKFEDRLILGNKSRKNWSKTFDRLSSILVSLVLRLARNTLCLSSIQSILSSIPDCLIDIDFDIDIFQNCLIDIDIDIDIFKNDHIDIDIDIDIFQKCRYIDNRYVISIYRTGLAESILAAYIPSIRACLSSWELSTVSC